MTEAPAPLPNAINEMPSLSKATLKILLERDRRAYAQVHPKSENKEEEAYRVKARADLLAQMDRLQAELAK